MRYVVIGCLAALALAVVLGGAGIWYFFVSEQPLLEATLEVPGEVTVDQIFDVVITLDNPHSAAVKLDSIDVDLAFLDAFQVLTIEPEPAETMVVPFIDQRSWSFGKSVPPGGRHVVTFRLRALEPGHYAGSFDACNPAQDFTSLYVDLVVVPRGAAE